MDAEYSAFPVLLQLRTRLLSSPFFFFRPELRQTILLRLVPELSAEAICFCASFLKTFTLLKRNPSVGFQVSLEFANPYDLNFWISIYVPRSRGQLSCWWRILRLLVRFLLPQLHLFFCTRFGSCVLHPGAPPSFSASQEMVPPLLCPATIAYAFHPSVLLRSCPSPTPPGTSLR